LVTTFCRYVLGLPYNIASYATLAILIEKITGYKDLAIQSLKVHVYDNSLDAVNEQVSRDTDKYKRM
jgi:thymidylate synthase